MEGTGVRSRRVDTLKGFAIFFVTFACSCWFAKLVADKSRLTRFLTGLPKGI